MKALETTLSVPLVVLESGAMRIKGSRVSLDSIVYQFNLGSTPEQIAHSFPAVPLPDVYAVLAFYLSNRAAVDEYIRQQDTAGDTIQQHVEADSQQQAATVELRERMLTRWVVETSSGREVL
jgi:uncharacterized protein (DUF433 family)